MISLHAGKHELLYIKLSSPVMHDTRSCEQIQWKVKMLMCSNNGIVFPVFSHFIEGH